MPNINKLVDAGIKELLCTKCNRTLPLTEFRVMVKWVNYCNDCEKKKLNAWRKENPEKTKQQKIRTMSKPENKKRANEYSKKWNREHPERTRELKRKTYQRNKQKTNQKFYNRLKNDPLYRIQNQLRTDINKKLKKIFGSCTDRPHKLLGCSIPEFKQYIESKFKPEMSWENYGGKRYNKDGTKRVCWELDHTIPMCSAKTKDEMYKLCHHTNLNPLWWWENMEKIKRDNKKY